jgi:hypothetical protein
MLLTTPLAPRSAKVKCKHSDVFSFVIEATNKKNKVILEAMDHFNTM